MYTSLKIILYLLISTNIIYCLEIGSPCKDKQNNDGVCKEYSECSVIKDKLINRKMSLKDIISCQISGVICCTLDSTPINTFRSQFNMRNVGDISQRKCKEYEKLTKTYVRVGVGLLDPIGTMMPTSICKHKSIPLIVGGEEASRYEFPHQAHMGYNTANGVQWACGGSLISSNYVLTAAHCNYQPSYRDIKFVKLGMISPRQNDSDVFIYNVNKVIKHPNYSPRNNFNDIALVKLKKHVAFSANIYPICLPTTQHDEPKAVVSGLGTTGRYDSQSDKLLKVVLEKFTQEECQEKIDPKNKTDMATILCYGNRLESKDACRGDSGGPIQVSNDDESHCTYKIIGIVSFGAQDCGTPGVPGVFVNVFKYLSWIEEIVWNDAQ